MTIIILIIIHLIYRCLSGTEGWHGVHLRVQCCVSHPCVGNGCQPLSGSALIDELQDLLSDGQGGWWT